MSATAANTEVSLSRLLRAVWPTHTAKLAARATGIPQRTIQDWLRDRCAPSWLTLYRMTQRNEALRAEYMRLLQDGETMIAAMAAPALASDVLGAGENVAGAGEPSDATPARRRPRVRAGP